MTRARVAMIGAGGFARRHLEVLERIDASEVVGHAARRREAAEAQAARFGGRAFADVAEMLDATRPDAVWITLPPAAHGAPELACVERGVPFFVEKPLSADLATAEAIASAVADRGLVAGVGYHWRAIDAVAEARAALAGREVRLVRGSWHSSTPPPAWWQRQETGGGQMVEQATHVLDLARHLIGEAEVVSAVAPVVPRERYPDSDVAAASAALLRYRAGPVGVFTATCALAGTAEVEVAFFAEGRRVVVDQHGVTIDDGGEVRLVRRRADPVETEDRAFLAAVRAGDPRGPICSYADALGTHRLAHAIRAAGEGG